MRNGRPSLQATVQHINPSGPVSRVQLLAVDFGVVVNVDLPHDRRTGMGLKIGDTVYVAPRKVRVFVPEGADYTI